MDTSKEYIKMCDMAGEIQAPAPYEPDSEYIFCNTYKHTDKCCACNNTIKQKPDTRTIGKRDNMMGSYSSTWLPRQDQLQAMIINFGHGHSNGGILVGLSIFSHEHGYDEKSMEQLWLGFVMSELHQKIWDGDKWVKAGLLQK